MIWLALALAQANPYAGSGPAKLIIIGATKPGLAIDYPTMQRCESARADLLRQTSKTEAVSGRTRVDLAKQLGRPVRIQPVTIYCIPG